MPVDERMIRRLAGCLVNPATYNQPHTTEEVKAIVRTVATGLDIPAFLDYDPLQFSYKDDCIKIRFIGQQAMGTIKFGKIDKRFRFTLSHSSLLEI